MRDTPDSASGLVVRLVGDVDIVTEDSWRATVAESLAARPSARDITLDLAEVGFLDSRGMAVLVHLHAEALGRGGKLTLRSTPDRVRKALGVAGLDQVFTMEA